MLFKYGYNCTQHQILSPGRYLSCCTWSYIWRATEIVDMRWIEKFKPRLLSPPLHSWSVMVWSERGCQIVRFRNVCEHICGWRRFILPSEESVGCETVTTSLTESWGRHTPMLSGRASSPWWHTPACVNTPLSYFPAPTWVRKAAVSLSASWMSTYQLPHCARMTCSECVTGLYLDFCF